MIRRVFPRNSNQLQVILQLPEYEGVHKISDNAGAKAFPHQCLLLGLCTRMAQYCIGPGLVITPSLASQFLGLLQKLIHLCLTENAQEQLGQHDTILESDLQNCESQHI